VLFSLVLVAMFGGCAAPPAAVNEPATQATTHAQVSGVPPTAADDAVAVDYLSNGLTVIVKRVPKAPVVCVRGYVRAGGLYEGPYLGCGISHLAEHLVAQGAEQDGGQTQAPASQPVGRNAQRLKDIGGQSNAYTSLDHTGYFISASSGKTAECIDLLADWLVRPDFTETDFLREQGVVQREQEMGKDDPERQLHYRHMANLYGTHPAAVPVIGNESPLAALTFQDLRDYHRRMYVPQNMVLSIAGDVDVHAVLQQVSKAFSDVPRGREPELMLPAVGPLEGVRRVTTSHPALKETLEEISFLTIPLLHEDLYSLDVLSYVLSQGPSSRLSREIYRQRKLVTAIDTFSWTPAWGTGSFGVSFRCGAETAEAAEAAILAELDKVARDGPQLEELERAKRQKVADLVYERQTVESQAAMLASDYLATGNVSFSLDYTRRIQAVTAEQVRRVARKYFTFDRMAVTRMTSPGVATQATSRPGGQNALAATAFTLPNGLRVVLQPFASSEAPSLVSVALVTAGGLLMEDERTNGLGNLMAALSTKGAGDRSAEQIAAFFDRAGGGIKGVCGNNTFYWQATVLDDSFPEALEILADVVQRPSFIATELEILRPAALTAVRQVEEDWRSQLDKFYRQRFFAGSPYHMLPVGRAEVIEAATVQQLAAHQRQCIRAGSSVLVIAGSFDPVAVRADVERLFGEVPAGEVDLKGLATLRSGGGGLAALKTDNKVAGVIVAVPGMTIRDLDDRIAMDVLDTIMSGYNYPAGWLHDQLRGRQLVYVVHAYNWAGLAPGAFVTYAACQPNRAAEVVDIIKNNYRRATKYLPIAAEVEQAVNTILTAELLENQSVASLALSAALDEMYGFGYDYRRRMEARYRAIQPADVQRVARKYLSVEPMVVLTSPLGGFATPATANTTTQATTAPASRAASAATTEASP
jgi:zinc protease